MFSLVGKDLLLLRSYPTFFFGIPSADWDTRSVGVAWEHPPLGSKGGSHIENACLGIGRRATCSAPALTAPPMMSSTAPQLEFLELASPCWTSITKLD